MVKTGPPRLLGARKGAGGPVFFSARCRSIGWPALLFSLALHGAIMAAAVWGIWGSQGSGGLDGMDLADEEMASSPAPVFRALPKTEPPRPMVKPRPTQSFAPSNLRRVLALNSQAEMTVPKWEMAPTRPLEAPAPAPATPVAEAAPLPEKTAVSAANEGKGTQTRRKAAGKGRSNGLGDALLAADAPRIVSSYAPVYPYQARKAGVQGTATVKVSVSDTGRVTDCSIWASTGSEALDSAALKAVRGWRFTPAHNASAQVLVKVTFRLS